MTVLAIDCMSGDHGCEVVLEACASLSLGDHVELLLVGDKAILESCLENKSLPVPWRIVHAPDKISMDDKPVEALRKKQSSIWLALEQLASGRAQALVSAGNTAALLIMARQVLGMLPGIDRPAIVSRLPSRHEGTFLLDLGANVSCTSAHLVQFAYIGAALASVMLSKESPSVALLNVGTEDAKGNDTVRQAASELSAGSLNYVGFVEGNDIYLRDVDVVVCDGFSGNILLKASEGIIRLLASDLQKAFRHSMISRLVGWLAKPVLCRMEKRFDPRKYNGASLLGLNGVVVKSHGAADAVAFANAIRSAAYQADNGLVSRTADALAITLIRENNE